MQEQLGLAQLRVRRDRIDPPANKRTGLAYYAVAPATPAKKQRRQIGTVRAGNTSYEIRLRCHIARNACTNRPQMTSQLGLLTGLWDDRRYNCRG